MLAVLIPAYQPPTTLVALVQAIVDDARVARVVVVDDGSSAESQAVFQALAVHSRVDIVRHSRNLGKGAALKSGLRRIVTTADDVTTIVTADADGQHLPADILWIGRAATATPGALIVGTRRIEDAAPRRSRFGNRLTRAVYRNLVGQQLADTQSGLRGFSLGLARDLVTVGGSGYEYELNVLITCRQLRVPVLEQPIATIYLEGNRLSHFRPVRDSLRIYSVLLRFGATSLASALLDNIVFMAAAAGTMPAALALAVARVVSASFNYPLARHWVFRHARIHRATFARYVTLLALNWLASSSVMGALGVIGLADLTAKVIVETLFFVPNFLLQRDVVFRANPQPRAATDWTAYYSSISFVTRCTRRYTARAVVRALRRAAAACGPTYRVTELGGASSCVVDAICRALRPDSYTVVDNNPCGVAQLAGWTPPPPSATRLTVHEADVRTFAAAHTADVVLSVGLIEHFDRSGTSAVVRAHFDGVRSGGAVIVSYPTPTLLYRAARYLLERLHLWQFPDERPLRFDEVAGAAAGLGRVVFRRTLWPIILTQEMVVFQKR
ncbi:MAG: bifunctional glycosyltransferase family 2/GtrA family protein [Acidobacteria bacterium]|nr:bifunctional glycosyltransferase family 2/GtrA family protein [Acidobacteriota bacterium]